VSKEATVQVGDSEVTLSVSNASRIGLGGVIARMTDSIEPGERITLTLHVGDRSIHLPGIVVWSTPLEEGFAVGLRLYLENAVDEDRRAYASWVRVAQA
jgi:hypothetical protein